MKLVAILRIKDAKLTIRECFDKLSELVDEIIVVDNGSTDGTLQIYKKYPKVVIVKHTHGFDEGRDRNLALTEARKRNADWILWIDSDEIFEKACTREILESYMNNSNINMVMFRMFSFWLSKKYYRVDSKWLFYTARSQRPLFRNLPTAHFSDKKFHGGNILGIHGKVIISPMRIKHFGYVYPQLINRRNKVYSKMGKEFPKDDKTLYCLPEDKVKLEKFQEFNNSILEKIRWDVIQKLEVLCLKRK